MLLPFFRTSWGVGVLNSATFNSFHNRVEFFGTILEGFRNFGGGGVWTPQPPLGTPLVNTSTTCPIITPTHCICATLLLVIMNSDCLTKQGVCEGYSVFCVRWTGSLNITGMNFRFQSGNVTYQHSESRETEQFSEHFTCSIISPSFVTKIDCIKQAWIVNTEFV